VVFVSFLGLQTCLWFDTEWQLWLPILGLAVVDKLKPELLQVGAVKCGDVRHLPCTYVYTMCRRSRLCFMGMLDPWQGSTSSSQSCCR
jgi:hypothetical protein